MRYAHEFPCQLCGGMNDTHHVVESSPEAESRALEIASLVGPICEGRGRMLGVMKASGSWIVCLSGGASVEYRFIQLMLDYDPDVAAIAHDWSTVPTRSLGGHDLTKLIKPLQASKEWRHYLKDSTGGVAGGPGCWCAAPKVVSYLTQDVAGGTLPPTNISMIELWVGKETKTRAHTEFAASCANCRKILPTLMCRKPFPKA
jgi:hypothetical protein